VGASERPSDALVREMEEELGIRVSSPRGPPLEHIQEQGLDLIVWAISAWEGDVCNRDTGEHDSLGWFDKAAVGRLELPHPAFRAMLSKALTVVASERSIWSEFSRRAGLAASADVRDVVEAIRLIPFGRPTERTAAGVVDEWRGTCSTKHELLVQIIQDRWPELDSRVMQRVYTLTPTVARRLFGEPASVAVPSEGMADVHTYMTVMIEARRIVIDATLPGPPWDGRSNMVLASGEGFDVDGGDDPRATKARLVREHCDAAARDRVIDALARLSEG
jgi:hypothetical protein